MAETLTCRIEPATVAELRENCQALFEQHWRDLSGRAATTPLDIDWQLYQAAAGCGRLRCVAVRRGDEWVGYAAVTFAELPQAQHERVARVEALFLAEDARRGRLGVDLIEAAMELGRDFQATDIEFAAKAQTNAVALLQELGFKPLETVYRRAL